MTHKNQRAICLGLTPLDRLGTRPDDPDLAETPTYRDPPRAPPRNTSERPRGGLNLPGVTRPTSETSERPETPPTSSLGCPARRPEPTPGPWGHTPVCNSGAYTRTRGNAPRTPRKRVRINPPGWHGAIQVEIPVAQQEVKILPARGAKRSRASARAPPGTPSGPGGLFKRIFNHGG
ncbi:hypothetical protein PUN28_020375 [Cardiocondyla obscurior]|uniref:Uncharacterized protein n=1 Tax=Cardiocondyla obscurior TaxID=286306 RepID=A0AAW2E7R5_9HYME